jgi:hypothetical protein
MSGIRQALSIHDSATRTPYVAFAQRLAPTAAFAPQGTWISKKLPNVVNFPLRDNCPVGERILLWHNVDALGDTS